MIIPPGRPRSSGFSATYRNVPDPLSIKEEPGILPIKGKWPTFLLHHNLKEIFFKSLIGSGQRMKEAIF